MENNIMITSGFNFEHYAITQYLGFCSTSSLYEGKLESAKKLHLKNFIPMQNH